MRYEQKERLYIIFILVLFLCIIFVSKARSDDEVGYATYYTQKSSVRAITANGEHFNENSLTCAAWWVPFNTILRVTNNDNQKSVIVRCNDRGPALDLYCAEYTDRPVIVDLSKEAFSRISSLSHGKIPVLVEVIK